MSIPYELPLFPLRAVLFPGMPLPLHVFEARYKTLIHECVRDNSLFGVVLLKSGPEAGAAAETHTVGTSTRIVNVERLAAGRFNIETLGQHRFRILELRHHRPYLAAWVENYPLPDGDSPVAQSLATRLRPWVARYMALLSKAAETPFDAGRLPTDPLTLAYLAAILLQTPMTTKQTLLAMPTAVDLLETERALFRSEIPLLDTLVSYAPADEMPFSVN